MGFLKNFFDRSPHAFDAVTGAAPIVRPNSDGTIYSEGLSDWNNVRNTGQATLIKGLQNQFGSGYAADYIAKTGGKAPPFLAGKGSASSAQSNYLNWTDAAGNPIGYGGGSGGSDSGGDSFSLPQYPYAEIASLYGMDQATAYQEALSATAHYREIQDLKRAGLNPVLSASGGRGAAVFGGDVAYPLSFGASSGASSGSASGVYYASGGSKKPSGLSLNLKDYNIRSGISSVVSGLTMAATKNFSAGAAAYYFTNAFLGALSKR